jgi:hypothetical protein
MNFFIFYEIDEQEAEHAESLKKAQEMLINSNVFYFRRSKIEQRN